MPLSRFPEVGAELIEIGLELRNASKLNFQVLLDGAKLRHQVLDHSESFGIR